MALDIGACISKGRLYSSQCTDATVGIVVFHRCLDPSLQGVFLSAVRTTTFSRLKPLIQLTGVSDKS
jgi:hypothetical protein